jgi:chaperone required for assembly of F1-ATPase
VGFLNGPTYTRTGQAGSASILDGSDFKNPLRKKILTVAKKLLRYMMKVTHRHGSSSEYAILLMIADKARPIRTPWLNDS